VYRLSLKCIKKNKKERIRKARMRGEKENKKKRNRFHIIVKMVSSL